MDSKARQRGVAAVLRAQTTLGLIQAGISRQITRLAEQRLADRRGDPDDAGACRIRLSDKASRSNPRLSGI